MYNTGRAFRGSAVAYLTIFPVRELDVAAQRGNGANLLVSAYMVLTTGESSASAEAF